LPSLRLAPLRRRAWLQARVPAAVIRLTRDYLPTHIPFENIPADEQPSRGSNAYYLRCIGGSEGLAQSYLAAGLLHLEGAATSLLHSSHSTLSSIRIRQRPHRPNESETEAWKRDREAASRYFDRVKSLQPSLDVPLVPPEGDYPRSGTQELEMPTIELNPSAPESVHSGEESHTDAETPVVRRRRKKEELVLFHEQEAKVADMDNAWYLYIPGLVGAGTALLVVGVIGALSFSTWRRNQGS